MAAAGIVPIRSFPYRGAMEEWSNKYHFQGDAPGTEADWRSLVDDFLALEAPAMTDVNETVRVICYEDTDDNSVYTYNLADFAGPVPGAYVTGSSADLLEAGDSAGLMRWNTGRRSTKGKPVYLFKYFHGVMHESGTVDQLRHTLRAAYATFANTVRDPSGDWPGLADKLGVRPIGYTAEEYITTHTLKHRGKRGPT